MKPRTATGSGAYSKALQGSRKLGVGLVISRAARNSARALPPGFRGDSHAPASRAAPAVHLGTTRMRHRRRPPREQLLGRVNCKEKERTPHVGDDIREV
ncbi:hypothetical protein MTO96_028207 [Rhipicephalus appendiculatus]